MNVVAPLALPPGRYLRFPDENHWVLKPQNSMQWHREVFGWLEKHIGGGR
ncbi:MAG: prolyl oligopeptidase family serine peptidase [Flavobacteriales bacterium]